MAEFTVWQNSQLLAILRNTTGLMKYPGGLPVAANSRAIRDGDIIAKNTSTNQACVCKFSELSATAAQSHALLTVDDAHPFQAADVITRTGAATEDLTIASINYDTNVITCTGNVAVSGGFAVNDDIHVATNNQDNPIGIALTPLEDRNARRTGLNANLVTDLVQTRQYGDIAIQGVFKLSAIRNFVVGTRMDTELGGADLAANDTYIMSSIPAANYSLT